MPPFLGNPHLQRNISIREAALERIGAGTLLTKQSGAKVTAPEVDAVLGDLRRLTEGASKVWGRPGSAAARLVILLAATSK